MSWYWPFQSYTTNPPLVGSAGSEQNIYGGMHYRLNLPHGTMDSLGRRQYLNALWAYYRNAVYTRNRFGGLRDQINDRLGGARVADLEGIFNPTDRIVDLYAHLYRGDWGKELRAEKPGTDEPVDSDLQKALAYLWSSSRMQVVKNDITMFGACMGGVGLRIVADPKTKRVCIRVVDPRDIKRLIKDADDTILEIELEYYRQEEGELVKYNEILTPEKFSLVRQDEGIRTSPNTVGVVPFVLVDHKRNPDDFIGLNAFHSSIEVINHICSIGTHLVIQVHRHVRPVWCIKGTGERPDRMQIDDQTLLVLATDPNSRTAPDIQALVADLNLADSIELLQQMRSELVARQPELSVTDGQYGTRSNISAELIDQLRAPAEERLLLARINYDYAFVQATKIAMLWMAELGLGAPSDPDWEFADRVALPLTEREKLMNQVLKNQYYETVIRAANDARNLSDAAAKEILEDADFPTELKEMTDARSAGDATGETGRGAG